MGNSRRSLRAEEWDRCCWGPTGDARWVRQAGALRIWCAHEENSPRPGGRYWRAGRAAVYLPGGARNRLADRDRHHALQGLAAVRRASLMRKGPFPIPSRAYPVSAAVRLSALPALRARSAPPNPARSVANRKCKLLGPFHSSRGACAHNVSFRG